jgi:hypothetical protein
MESVSELDTVALLKDIPEYKLSRGNVGTVVMMLSESVAEVEFTNTHGETTSLIPLNISCLMKLKFDLANA